MLWFIHFQFIKRIQYIRKIYKHSNKTVSASTETQFRILNYYFQIFNEIKTLFSKSAYTKTYTFINTIRGLSTNKNCARPNFHLVIDSCENIQIGTSKNVHLIMHDHWLTFTCFWSGRVLTTPIFTCSVIENLRCVHFRYGFSHISPKALSPPCIFAFSTGSMHFRNVPIAFDSAKRLSHSVAAVLKLSWYFRPMAGSIMKMTLVR